MTTVALMGYEEAYGSYASSVPASLPVHSVFVFGIWLKDKEKDEVAKEKAAAVEVAGLGLWLGLGAKPNRLEGYLFARVLPQGWFQGIVTAFLSAS
jgi:hypothetical protein